MQSEREKVLRLLEERAAGYGALRQSSTTAIAMDRAVALIRGGVSDTSSDYVIRRLQAALRVCRGWLITCSESAQARRDLTTLDEALALRPADQGEGWRTMESARKDGSSVLLLLKNPLPVEGRPDLDRWHGLAFVGRHPGVADDGFDIGWGLAAPVGQGGFPDDWFVGWQPVPAAPALDRKGAAS